MDAMEVGRLTLGLIDLGEFDKAVSVVQTVTGFTYEEAACRLSWIVRMRAYDIEMPIDTVYELIVSNECLLLARLIGEYLAKQMNELAGTLYNIGYILGDIDERPAEKPAERQNPIIGLSPAESAFPAHIRPQRWHTAATGE